MFSTEGPRLYMCSLKVEQNKTQNLFWKDLDENFKQLSILHQ